MALLRSFSISFFLLLVIAQTSYSLPFVFIHGLWDDCSSNKSIHIVKYLKGAAGVKGECLEIGNGFWDAFVMPLLDPHGLHGQIQIACEKVKALDNLKDGFNIFAVSQGALIARGLIEFCDGAPPVNNYISLAGPQAGIGGLPGCENKHCNSQDWFEKIVYTELIQNLAAPPTYYKVSTKIEEYLENSKFLPKLNNERPGEKNQTYKDRFASLNKLVLLRNENDTTLVPNETAWFGFYRDGTKDVIPVQETQLYKEDWIGLRSLMEAGRVKFDNVTGGHADASDNDLTKFVVPFLKDEQPPSTLNYNYASKLLYRNV